MTKSLRKNVPDVGIKNECKYKQWISFFWCLSKCKLHWVASKRYMKPFGGSFTLHATQYSSHFDFDLYQSSNRLPIWNSQNCSMFPLAFDAGWLQGHWWGLISRNYVVWPTFLLMNVWPTFVLLNVFIALKGSHFWFLFDFTAAGVVPCGGRKTSPRTSTIVQFIFYFGPLRSAIIFWEIKNKWLL